MELKDLPLGRHYTDGELETLYKQIFGGVVWPGKNPGFAVVVGMGHDKHFDSHDIYLLDEFESFDIRELVRQCSVFTLRYQPTMFIGDNKNDAADRFIREVNSESQIKENPQKVWYTSAPQRRRQLSVYPTPILDMACPYPYMMSELKSLLNIKCRQLHLKGGMVANYLRGIEPSIVSTFGFGEFPAIEALAFAVTEMRQRAKWSDDVVEEESPMAGSYSVNTVL